MSPITTIRRTRAALATSAALLALELGSLCAPGMALATQATPEAGEPSRLPAGAEAPQQPSSAPVPAPSSTPLSNELTLSSWAHPEGTGSIYVHPDTRSARVAKVHLYTADGFLEVYPLLSSSVDITGREWDRVRIPGRPNGRTGWVLRELLGPIHHTHWRIAVSRSQRRMRVYYAGQLLKVFPVGVGKPSTPTPAGHFWIDERFKLSNPNNPYWPYALGTSDYSTLPNWPGEGVIGIHGPFGEPQKIPGDPSHGCIRMLSPDIAWLGGRVSLGTPVEVT